MTGAEESSRLSDALSGRVVQGRYRVGRVIGRGGMGVVYDAHHLLIGRRVAIKVLSACAALDSACVLRFQREARAAAAVGNSHIVDVLDMGQLDDGTLFIVLEHLDGAHLGWSLARAGRFPASRAIHVLCQLCDALHAVHSAGIVHRDLKPENIFLIERDGEPDFVKVLDFGVCRFKDRDAASLTTSGDLVGTPLFMAPEQIDSTRDVGHRTDVYALGAILHYLLTGRAPFDAATLTKLCLQICTEPPPSLRASDPSLPAELDQVVKRALDKSPEGRFESCLALKHALLKLGLATTARSRSEEELAATLLAPSSHRASRRSTESDDWVPVVVLERGGRRAASVARAVLGGGVALAVGAISVGLAVRPQPVPAERVTKLTQALLPRPSSPGEPRSVSSIAPPPVVALTAPGPASARALRKRRAARTVDEWTAPTVPASEHHEAAADPSATAEVPSATAEVPSATAEVPTSSEQPPLPALAPGMAPFASASPRLPLNHGPKRDL